MRSLPGALKTLLTGLALLLPVPALAWPKFINSTKMTLEIRLANRETKPGVAALRLFRSAQDEEPMAGKGIGLDLEEPLTQLSLTLPPGHAAAFSRDIPEDAAQEQAYVIRLKGDATGENFWIALSHQASATEPLRETAGELWYDRPYHLSRLANGDLELKPVPADGGLRRKRPRRLATSMGSSLEQQSSCNCGSWCVIL